MRNCTGNCLLWQEGVVEKRRCCLWNSMGLSLSSHTASQIQFNTYQKTIHLHSSTMQPSLDYFLRTFLMDSTVHEERLAPETRLQYFHCVKTYATVVLSCGGFCFFKGRGTFVWSSEGESHLLSSFQGQRPTLVCQFLKYFLKYHLQISKPRTLSNNVEERILKMWPPPLTTKCCRWVKLAWVPEWLDNLMKDESIGGY